MIAPAQADPLSFDVTLLAIYVGGFSGLLATIGLVIEAIDKRRTRHAEEKALRGREDAYYEQSLRTASQLGVTWPPPRIVKGGRS